MIDGQSGHSQRDPRGAGGIHAAAAITAASIAAAALLYALLIWDRRWIADDGLIVVRTAREILAGNGPVYNLFERAEPTTSTLWLWLVAGASWVTHVDPALVAVALGGGLAVAGLVIALDATRRLYRDSGCTTALVPAGVLVVLAVFPFWDYGTSGLETGLAAFWLAAIWWLLVALGPASRRTALLGFAVAVGLGPLVRPEFALATTVFLVAGCRAAQPPRRRIWQLAVAAIALPLAYEVFRAGYYGALVPLPALAKSATSAAWGRGLAYLTRFVRPHLLYIPFSLLAGAMLTQHRALARRRAVVLAPVITALLLAGFVVRVGGDFMHGRMLLPAALLLIMPALVVPPNRITVAAAIAVSAWALFIGIRSYTTARHVPADERIDYVKFTNQRNPVTAADHLAVRTTEVANVASALRSGHHLVFSDGGIPVVAMDPARDAPVAFADGRLGFAGAIVPLDGIAVDLFGLGNPLGARITPTWPGSTGHEKRLPWAWVLADIAAPSAHSDIPPAQVAAARHALTCGAIAELLSSAREPMTPSRFWANLVGSVQRTRLVIPADPIAAEREFCTR